SPPAPRPGACCGRAGRDLPPGDPPRHRFAARGGAGGLPGPADKVEVMPNTARLSLTPMSPSDAKDLFPIFSDPDGWWFAPESRHLELATTEGFLERAAMRWEFDGLSYWTARALDDDRVIGVGGVQRHR